MTLTRKHRSQSCNYKGLFKCGAVNRPKYTCASSLDTPHYQENGCAHVMIKGISLCQYKSSILYIKGQVYILLFRILKLILWGDVSFYYFSESGKV